MSLPNSKDKQEFIKIFNSIARHKHRYTIFSDFVTMASISLHNAVSMSQELEGEYMKIVGQYSKEDVSNIVRLLTCLIEILQEEPTDALGSLYMELELGSTNQGQFFTPSSLSELMASITYGEELKDLKKPFITLSEPACGAGGMVLAFVKIMLSHGHNPAEKLWVQCIDIDRIAGLMCYLQLSLWNVPAQVIIGNTLSLDFREQFFTPAYYMFGWHEKLRLQKMFDLAVELVKPPKKAENITPAPPKEKRILPTESRQIDLFDL